MTTPKPYAPITGATSGIGRELAKLFANDNYNLVIVTRSQPELDQTAAELKQSGIDVLTITKDLSQRQVPSEVYQEVKGLVLSGFKNQLQVVMSNIMPENMVAATVGKQQAPKSQN